MSTYKRYHRTFLFLVSITLLGVIISASSCVVASGIISFFFMPEEYCIVYMDTMFISSFTCWWMLSRLLCSCCCCKQSGNEVVVHVCLGIMISEDKGMPGRGTLEFCGWSVFLYFQDLPAALHIGCAALYSHWWCRHVLLFPCHVQYLLFGDFWRMATFPGGRWYIVVVLICIYKIVVFSKFSCGFLSFFFFFFF